MKEKTFLNFVELGRYLERFSPDDRIYICSDDFYLSSTVNELRCSFRNLLRLEVAYVDYYPRTLYI